MKCDIQQKKDAFTPVVVTLTLESQDEVDVLAAVFNTYAPGNVMSSAGLDITSIYSNLPKKNDGQWHEKVLDSIIDWVHRHRSKK